MTYVEDLQAGPELDQLIYVKLFKGSEESAAPPFSQNPETGAWLAQRFGISIRPVYASHPAWLNPANGEVTSPVMEYFGIVRDESDPLGVNFLATGKTKELAVCRSALMLHGVADTRAIRTTAADIPREATPN